MAAALQVGEEGAGCTPRDDITEEVMQNHFHCTVSWNPVNIRGVGNSPLDRGTSANLHTFKNLTTVHQHTHTLFEFPFSFIAIIPPFKHIINYLTDVWILGKLQAIPMGLLCPLTVPPP